MTISFYVIACLCFDLMLPTDEYFNLGKVDETRFPIFLFKIFYYSKKLILSELEC